MASVYIANRFSTINPLQVLEDGLALEDGHSSQSVSIGKRTGAGRRMMRLSRDGKFVPGEE
jgi:hypothetical protein